MKYLYITFLLAITTGVMAQSPVRETLAYSRQTTPGIPGAGSTTSSQNPLPTSYLIYVIVRRGTLISVTAACIDGKPYGATLKKVSTPVLTEHDVNVPSENKDTLVKKTIHDAYQVEIEPTSATPGQNCTEDKLAQQYPVVVYLKSGQHSWRGLASHIVSLPPAAAP